MRDNQDVEVEKPNVDTSPIGNVNEEVSASNENDENDEKEKPVKESGSRKSDELSDEELERRRNALLQQLHADPEESD